ncbi:MAG: glycosyltransferase family 4 protein [Candidatus Hydrogenedentes bacterium]|nr:glycosyltransferase family 4 protein [Candidatus Hydrogenedentota bacterium]
MNDTANNAGPPVRLLILSTGDPEAERPFSGSLRSLCSALERRGIVHHKANVNGYTDTFSAGPWFVRLLKKVDRFGLLDYYRWSSLACARNTRRARRAAREHPGFNACLMYGTTFDPRLDVPTYCYFDGTAAQAARVRGWELSHFSSRKVQQIIDYQRRVFERCTAIFPRTQWAAGSVLDDYAQPPEKVQVASAGPNYLAEPLPHGPYDTQTILYIGRDFERKGGPLILDAFRKVREQLADARLVIVGCSPPINEPGVEIVGPIVKDSAGGLERILELYSRASLFCIMSYYEPFGIVVIEAQNCYVPCVVPAQFAFTEMVVDGVTGRHVKEYDAGLLADTLLELLSDPARLEAMGRAAHAHVHANFTWDVAARRIHERIQRDLAGSVQVSRS